MDENQRNQLENNANSNLPRGNAQPTNINEQNGLANNRDEETAREITPDVNDHTPDVTDEDNDTEMFTSSAIGWVALLLSIISFFWLPIIFAGAGIITGFMSRNRGAETLGNLAIGASIVSLILTLFVAPFMY